MSTFESSALIWTQNLQVAGLGRLLWLHSAQALPVLVSSAATEQNALGNPASASL